MSAVNNGGPAFPVADSVTTHRIGQLAIEGITDTAERDRVYIEVTARANAGMTLRDYFAAKALAGIASTVDINGTVYWREVAADAYAAADAMLAERAK
jgi:hypothetical protein